jgi:MFS family permease
MPSVSRQNLSTSSPRRLFSSRHRRAAAIQAGGARRHSTDLHTRAPLRALGMPLRPAVVAPRPAEIAQPTSRIRRLVAVAFINRNFARLWWGQTISSIGDYAFDTALVLWVATYLAAGQSWAPLAVSGLILAAALPQIFAGPIAGVFVDRWNKRRTLLVMIALQAIFASFITLVAAGISLPFVGRVVLPVPSLLALIFGVVSLITICAQFVIPAQFALIKDIVPDSKQDQAMESSQAIQALAIVLGPPAAAALVFGLGVQWALLLNALSFLVAFGATFAIQAPPSASSLAAGETGNFSREFFAGVGYVTGHRILRTILISEVLTWLGFGCLQALGYFFITGNLHAPASDYGFLGSVFGVGAIVGAVFVTIMGHRIGLARLLWMSLVTSGTFVIVLSHLTNIYAALAAAFGFGITATIIIVTAGPLSLDATSREFVGRVTAVINPIGRLAALVSVVVAGYLVSTVLRGFHATILGIHFGPVDTVFTVMGMLAVAGGIYARLSLHAMIRKGEPGLVVSPHRS